MPYRHDSPILPAPLIAEASEDGLRVSLPEGQEAKFLLLSVPLLTRRTATEILDRADRETQRILVSYRQSSAEARKALRAADISFRGDDGRAFVRAPGIFVERDERRRLQPAKPRKLQLDADDSTRNPFAKRSSRVPRWLLLHHEEAFSPSELANAVDLNPASVSRIVRALEDAALVHETSVAGGHRRKVHLARSRALLEGWLPLWQRRRVRRMRWDIGARDVDDAFGMLREVGEDLREDWAIGGLAGAAMVRRAVEPADVLVWVDPVEVARLERALQPVPAQGGRGAVRIAMSPDPWTLGLAHEIDGLRVADSVQLWLDCASEGERALEAADALAQVAGWS